MPTRTDLLQGTLDLLVLKALLLGPSHGWAISKRIRQLSDDVLEVGQGSLYPALYRLEHAGFLGSETRIVAGRTRRTYAITASGRAALRERQAAWQKLVRSIAAVMGEGPVPDHG